MTFCHLHSHKLCLPSQPTNESLLVGHDQALTLQPSFFTHSNTALVPWLSIDHDHREQGPVHVHVTNRGNPLEDELHVIRDIICPRPTMATNLNFMITAFDHDHDD